MDDKTDSETKMKDCFGVNFGWFMEDMIGDEIQRETCYHCADYDACYKMAMVRSLTQLRFEIRKSAHTVGRAIGGSHSTVSLWMKWPCRVSENGSPKAQGGMPADGKLKSQTLKKRIS